MSHEDPGILTRLELQLMQVIWRTGAGTVTAVQAGLTQELAYTTVQTMLNILVRKGHLKRKLRGRAFHYTPAVSEARATGHAVRDLIDRMFGGSGEQLMMTLLQERQIDAKTLEDLTRRLEKQTTESQQAAAGPPDARAAGISGSVVLQARIGKDGVVQILSAISGPPELQAAAIDAVKQWVYRPYLLNGAPVEVNTTITVNYHLAK